MRFDVGRLEAVGNSVLVLEGVETGLFGSANYSVASYSESNGAVSPDGRELFYCIEPDTIMAVTVTPGPNPTPGKPAVALQGSVRQSAQNSGRHYDVSPDGKRSLLLKDAETADGAKPAAPEIHLVQHWSEELKRLLPAK